MCKPKKVTWSENPKYRVYKGSMNGGLPLDQKLKKTKHRPIVGIVDDLKDDPAVNTDALKREHLEEAQHFGIHLSKLETLANERVKDKETDIVDIF